MNHGFGLKNCAAKSNKLTCCSLHLAFRFHGNFYHSYRGDTPDELGFGTDIRIIRNTLRVLDEFNSSGVPVRGTWDFENYPSLEKIMPEHCPNLIDFLQRRATAQAFAYPAAFNGNENLLNLASYRSRQSNGLGENPDGLGPGVAYTGRRSQ